MDGLLVAAILADLVTEPDMASGEDTTLGSPHDHLVVGHQPLYRLHHSLWEILAPHLPHHFFVQLPSSERHLTVRSFVRLFYWFGFFFRLDFYTAAGRGGGGDEE